MKYSLATKHAWKHDDIALCNYLFLCCKYLFMIHLCLKQILNQTMTTSSPSTVTLIYIKSIPILIYRMHVWIHQICSEMWGSNSGVAEDTGVLECDAVSMDKRRQSNTFHLNPQQISSYHKFTVTVFHNNDFCILDNSQSKWIILPSFQLKLILRSTQLT